MPICLASVENEMRTCEGKEIKSNILNWKPVRTCYSKAIEGFRLLGWDHRTANSGWDLQDQRRHWEGSGPTASHVGPVLDQPQQLRALPQWLLKPPRTRRAQPVRGTCPSAPLSSWARAFLAQGDVVYLGWSSNALEGMQEKWQYGQVDV